MKTESQILDRMVALRDNVGLLDAKLDEELKKELDKRDYRLLRFLRQEQAAWQLALQELQWIVQA